MKYRSMLKFKVLDWVLLLMKLLINHPLLILYQRWLSDRQVNFDLKSPKRDTRIKGEVQRHFLHFQEVEEVFFFLWNLTNEIRQALAGINIILVIWTLCPPVWVALISAPSCSKLWYHLLLLLSHQNKNNKREYNAIACSAWQLDVEYTLNHLGNTQDWLQGTFVKVLELWP